MCAQRWTAENTAEQVPLQVFLAHDRLMERDALSRALAILRPALSIHLVEPQALSRELRYESPEVVIVTTPHREVEARVPVWILLHEDGTSRCVVSIQGRRTEHDDLGLPAILDILDALNTT